ADCIVFHAGTQKAGDRIVSSGGRVLAVSAWGSSLKESLDTAYRNARMISFENIYYRKDIGFDL
ncbi:MAG TPA: phosphoribosylglycinamide synthetase C domain-containing protein, partial [Bacteroidales bacterium]|nr:phosphoribosylglycinamide synthetase C domain-containing protein [Bacteroidales bacterium]